MKTLIYDCEIIRCIPGKGGKLPGFEYCKGWEDFEGMGISVIGVMDAETQDACAFVDPELSRIGPEEQAIFAAAQAFSRKAGEFLPLRSFHNFDNFFSNFKKLIQDYDQIIGFNSKKFDDNLCKANGINITTTFDLLEEVRIKAYGSPRWEDCPKGYTYSLGALGEANGFPKTGSGELAPQLWQQGRHREVIRYCLNDVKITYELWRLFCDGKLKDPNTGKFL